jgi:tetratricopeptide (TPR) repeat protein
MAAKVNTKFVLILAMVMISLFAAVAATAIFVIKKSGDDYIRLGDGKAAQNDWKGAQEYYSKAVFKEQGNVAYLNKWLEALRKWTPATQTQLDDAYQTKYINCLRQIGVASKTDLKAWHEYLGTLNRMLTMMGFSRDGYENMVSQADLAMKYFEGLPANPEMDSLRRYSGLSIVRQMRENLIDDRAKEQMEKGKADLDAALKARASDWEVARALMEWNLIRADRARRGGQNDEARAYFDSAAKIADDYAQANPDEPQGWLMAVGAKYEMVRKLAVGVTIDQKLADTMNQAVTDLRPQFDELFKKLMALDAKRINSDILDKFEGLEPLATRSGKFELMQQLCARGLEGNPDDYDLMFRLSRIYEMQGKFAESNAQLQKIVDLPPRPVSIEAVRLYPRKIDAIYEQAVNTFRLNDAATDDKERAETLAQAKGYREALGKLVPSDSLLLKYLDANIALATRDMPGAQKLLVEYNRATDNRNTEALWKLARAAMALNQPGQAKQQYQAILDRDRDNVYAVKALGALELQLQNLDAAVDLLERAKTLDPADQNVVRQLELAKSIQKGTAEVSDPVTKIMLQAQAAYLGKDKQAGDVQAGIKILRDGLTANPGDSRLTQLLVSYLVRASDEAGAREAVETALKVNANDENLKVLLMQLTEKDPYKLGLQIVNASSDPELDKQVDRYTLARRYNKPEDAAREWEAMKKTAPDDPRVIEIDFVQALEAKELDRSRQIVQKAEQMDLDKVNGLTFKARQLIAEGKSREAIIALEDAQQRGVLNQQTLLLLARLQLQSGRGTDAVKTYSAALSLRPNDLPVIKERIRAFVANGQVKEALVAAREAERIGSGDAEFDDLRLQLEAMAGNKQQALEERLRIAARDPKNMQNKLAVATIQIELGRYNDARKMIDEVRAAGDSLEAVTVDARWYAEQNDMLTAGTTFEKYINGLDQKTMTPRPWLTYGQFVLQRNYPSNALAIFEKAREYQDPKTAEVDKIIGDTCANLNLMERAADAFKRVVDAGADTDGVYRKRLIEALSKAMKFDAAEKELAAMGDAVDKDPVLLMLRADILRGKKDTRGARDVLDRTIQRFPTEFMPYLRRAQLMSEQTGSDAEVVADLEAALRVNPQGWQASMLLSSFYAQRDRLDDAVKYARMTLRIRPDLTDFFQSVTRELLRRGNDQAAVDLADDLLRARSNDAQLLSTVGEVFREGKQYTRAIGYYKQALALSKQPSTAVSLVMTALLDTPPRLDEAEAAIRSVQAQVELDPQLLLIRADVLFRRGKVQEAENDITSALKIIPRDNPNAILAWFLRSRALFREPAKHMAYLEKLRTQGAMIEWFQFFKAATNVDRPTPEEKLDGIKQLESVIQNTTNPAVATLAHRMRVSTLYSMKKYQESVDAARQGLEKFPDDWELNNNFAFISAKYLNKPDDALPAAERATKGAMGSADAWDTLGWIQLKLNKIDEAEASLARALGLAGPNTTRIPIQLHLAEIAVIKKNKALAEDRLKDAERTMEANPTVADDYKAEAEAVRKKIDSM